MDIIRGQRHVIVNAGRYETSDLEVIQILRLYQGVSLVSTQVTPATKPAGGFTGPGPIPPAEPAIKPNAGLQMKQRRPQGWRVVESEAD